MTINDEFNPGTRVQRATARVASTAKDGIDAATNGADRALDAASSKLQDARTLAPTLKQGIDQAKGWVDDQAGRVQDGVLAARDKAYDLSDQIVSYTRDEPVKALLIAAAVGAGLMGLLGLIARSGD